MKVLNKLWKEQSGQGLIEYAFILALVSMGIVVTLRSIGQSLIPKFQSVVDGLP